MKEPKEFSYEKIFNKIEDFCITQNITLQDLKNFDRPPLIFEQIFIDNNKGEIVSGFNISKFHKLNNEFSKFLAEKYMFNSKMENIIEDYNNFFSEKNNFHIRKHNYSKQDSYIINDDSNIEKIIVFGFDDLMGMSYTKIVEKNDSNIKELENKLFNYYKEILEIKDIPEYLDKALSEMNEEEKDVLKIIIENKN